MLPLRSLAAACLGFALSFAAQGLSQSGQSQPDIAPSVERLLSIEGEALNPKSGAVVYREFHFCDKQSISCQVKYEDSNGTPIIEKELDFSGIYLCYCEGGFRERVISTAQIVMAKPDYRLASQRGSVGTVDKPAAMAT